MTILPPLKRVVVESPWRASQAYSVEQHEAYLNHCRADCLSRGEYPFASHGEVIRALNDDEPFDRALGISGAWVWGDMADLVAVYTDFGISEGMRASIAHYEEIGKPIERRKLNPNIVLDIIRTQ